MSLLSAGLTRDPCHQRKSAADFLLPVIRGEHLDPQLPLPREPGNPAGVGRDAFSEGRGSPPMAGSLSNWLHGPRGWPRMDADLADLVRNADRISGGSLLRFARAGCTRDEKPKRVHAHRSHLGFPSLAQ